jgi:hypothetical protein
MKEASCPLPTRAYDLTLVQEEGGPGRDSHGWCFGLPPGISPERWPLDPQTGYPLVHGFTLRLPPDYCCHGPDIVGLSFFAFCAEHSDGGTTPDGEILQVMTGKTAPEDERYLPFWAAVQNSHPRLFRMSDILDDNYAVILLTEEELNGPLCLPPDTTIAESLSYLDRPRWLDIGNGSLFFGSEVSSGDAQRHYLFKVLGGVPEPRLDWSRALRWAPRAVDPNAGKAPEDFFTGPKTSGYQQPFYFEEGADGKKEYRTHPWTKDHERDHIGGTMQPVQGTPRFSPFYVEFNEYLGGYNFGTGNCQLDFLNMQLDWACG